MKGVPGISTTSFTSTLKLLWRIPVPNMRWNIWRSLQGFFVSLVATRRTRFRRRQSFPGLNSRHANTDQASNAVYIWNCGRWSRKHRSNFNEDTIPRKASTFFFPFRPCIILYFLRTGVCTVSGLSWYLDTTNTQSTICKQHRRIYENTDICVIRLKTVCDAFCSVHHHCTLGSWLFDPQSRSRVYGVENPFRKYETLKLCKSGKTRNIGINDEMVKLK